MAINHIITSKIEHKAVLETCRFLETQGFEATYIDVDKQGKIDLKDLEKKILFCEDSVRDKEEIIDSIDDKISAAVEEQTTEINTAKDLCLDTLTVKEEELAVSEAKYNSLVTNVARSICCKQRVDNPEISAYDVVENKIVCLSSGSKPLSC